jgi:hypothetical protein
MLTPWVDPSWLGNLALGHFSLITFAAEIDKTVKKIDEGIEGYDDLFEEVRADVCLELCLGMSRYHDWCPDSSCRRKSTRAPGGNSQEGTKKTPTRT